MPRPGGGEDTGQAPTPGIDPNAPQDHAAPKRGFDRLADQFERLGRQSSGESARERADELRRRAEEMLENATPEERRRMLEEFEQFRRERAARGMDPLEGPTPRELAAGDEEIDLTDPEREAPERPIGDWYSDRPRLPDDEASRRALLDTVRESRQAAERGVEAQRIPRRYQDFIRRVFDRYADEIERGTGRGPVDGAGGTGGSGGGGGG